MDARIIISDIASTSGQPLFDRVVPTLTDTQRLFLARLLELLATGRLSTTTVAALDTYIAIARSSALGNTNATAIQALLDAIKAGTDVATVVTAINLL